jgi:hypothetical protein
MTELAMQLDKLITDGDERAVRTFVIEHIMEFPKPIRNEIIFAFFAEAMENDIKTKQALSGMINDGLQALKMAHKDAANLQDKKEILNVQKKINGRL